MIWHHMLVSCCTNPTKNTHTQLVLVPARTAVKLWLKYGTGKIKPNLLEPHFQSSATTSRSLERTKTAVALSHSSGNT